MVQTVGISKSAVSREFIEASEEELRKLCERRFDEVEFLVIYLDGMVFGDHHVIGAVGVDTEGRKHVLGLVEGASENGAAVTSLLESLVERGLEPSRRYLFVIDGSKALRSAISRVFGNRSPVQRCRAHKVRNVSDKLPEDLKDQGGSVMKAAYKLPWKDGMAKLKIQAEWLSAHYPDASASLLEGLEETFTLNRLDLSPSLRRCLGTIHITLTKREKMKTLICSTCGCSLVRLGISNDDAVVYNHDGNDHTFCCQGCVDLFITDPGKFLDETKDLIVCFSCLAEKPLDRSAGLSWSGQEVRFCRCPFCREVFQKNPEHYIDRYEGKIPVESVLSHN